MGLFKDFRGFLAKGSVIDLAVAVVMGTAFGRVISAIVEGVVMPIIGRVMPGNEWESWAPFGIRIGAVLGAILDFLLISFVLYLIVIRLMRTQLQKFGDATLKDCPECLEKIPTAARRCKFCTAPLAA